MKRIYLEITNACNLDCPFCTAAKGERFLSLEDFDSYTDQIREVTEYIYLHVLGEPLLHPRFEDFLKILDAKGFKLQLVTNGTLLERYPDLTGHKCLRKLSVSVHSVNRVSVGESYFDTIEKLITKQRDCSIELRFYDLENLDERIRRFHDSLLSRYGMTLTSKRNSYKLTDKTYIYYEELFDWPDMDSEELPEEGTCHGIIDQIAILSDGIVTSCCLDPKGINELGDMKKDLLKETLESDRYLNARNDLLKGKLTLKLCRHCSYRLRFGCRHS